MFIQRFPTPQALLQAGKRQWEKFLHTRHLWRSESAPRRMELFAQAAEFAASQATTSAKSLLALSLVQLLLALEKQLAEYRKRIEELFARHPDQDLFGSLPGAGKKLAPRLVAEIGTDRSRFEQASNLQCFAGSAPLSVGSGRHKSVHRRFGCNKHLRHALHLFAEKSLRQCVWAERYYNFHRSKGSSHADAIRRLAHRWLLYLSVAVFQQNLIIIILHISEGKILPKQLCGDSRDVDLNRTEIRKFEISHGYF